MYRRVDGRLTLEPARLEGEYVIHVGGERELVECVEEGLGRIRGKELVLKIGSNLVSFRIEKVVDATGPIIDKAGREYNTVTLYFKAPVKFANIYTATRLPILFPSAPVALAIPYLMLSGVVSIDDTSRNRAMHILGQLVETYYSINTIKPVLLPFKERREPAIMGYVTYIADTRKPEDKQIIANTLALAEIAGIGESRANGFGTITFIPKP